MLAVVPALPVLLLGLLLVGGYYVYENGRTVNVVRPPSPAGSVASFLPQPGGGPQLAGSVGAGPLANALGPQAGQPLPPAPSPVSNPTGALSWLFSSGADALKAGYGNLFQTAQGISVTTGKGPLAVKTGTVYASSSDALKAGYGSVYQDKGSYFVTGPAGPTKLSAGASSAVSQFSPLDTSVYGTVVGTVRGWALTTDRTGAPVAVPAHSVAGSTYQGDATGPAPTQQEWAALSAARGSLQSVQNSAQWSAYLNATRDAAAKNPALAGQYWYTLFSQQFPGFDPSTLTSDEFGYWLSDRSEKAHREADQNLLATFSAIGTGLQFVPVIGNIVGGSLIGIGTLVGGTGATAGAAAATGATELAGGVGGGASAAAKAGQAATNIGVQGAQGVRIGAQATLPGNTAASEKSLQEQGLGTAASVAVPVGGEVAGAGASTAVSIASTAGQKTLQNTGK